MTIMGNKAIFAFWGSGCLGHLERQMALAATDKPCLGVFLYLGVPSLFLRCCTLRAKKVKRIERIHPFGFFGFLFLVMAPKGGQSSYYMDRDLHSQWNSPSIFESPGSRACAPPCGRVETCVSNGMMYINVGGQPSQMCDWFLQEISKSDSWSFPCP